MPRIRRAVIGAAILLAALGTAQATVLSARARAADPPVVVGVGGTATPHSVGPETLTTNGYGAGLSVGEEGTTHIAWNEPSPDNLDTVHYCRIPRGPGTTCDRRDTFSTAGYVTPDPGTRYDRDAAHPVIVLTPRPDEVIIITTRYRDPAQGPLAVGADGSIGACGMTNPCNDVTNPVFAWVSRDGGTTFKPKVIAEQRGGVVAASVLTVDAGTPDERDLILLFGDQNQLNVTSADTFTAPCLDLTGPGGNLPAEASITSSATDVTLAFNQGDDLYLRRFAPSAGATGGQTITDLCNEARWGSWRRLPGTNTSARLAGGPRGTFLLTENQAGSGTRRRQARDVTNGKDGDTTDLGRAHRDAGLLRRGDIAQDGLGGLAAAWVDPRQDERGATVGHDLRYGHADAGQPLLAATTLRSLDSSRAAPDVERLRMSLLDDGGGAVVYEHAGAAAPTGGAQISVLLFGSRAPRPVDDVHLTGAEITQGIQSLTPLTRSSSRPGDALAYPAPGTVSARLIQGRNTIVRVYASVRRALGSTLPQVQLRVRRDGALGPPIAANNPTAGLPVGDAYTVPPAQHQGTTQVYTFVVPPVSDFANYTYEVAANPAGVMPTYAECARCRGVDNFLKLGPQRFFLPTTVHILPIELAVGTTNPNQRVRDAANGPGTVFATTRTILPVQLDVPPFQGFYNIGGLAQSKDKPEDRAAEARDLVSDWSDDNNKDRSGLFPIGLYPFDGRPFGARGARASDGYWLRGGKSYNHETGDPARCSIADCADALYQDRQPTAVLGDDPARDVIETAHEITHGLNFKHAGTDRGCYPEDDPGGDQIGEPWPAGADGRIDGIGLDTRSGTPPFTRVVSDPTADKTTVYDMMSYCAVRSTQPVPAWLSLYNWNRISGYFAPPQGSSAAVRSIRARAVRSSTRQAGSSSLEVTATVPADGRGAHVVRVQRAPHVPFALGQIRRQGPWGIVARSRAGAIVFRAAVERTGGQDAGTGLDSLRAWVPIRGVTRVDVVRVDDGSVLATRTATPHAPRVRITAPSRRATIGRSATVELRWSVTDRDPGQPEAWVDYAADGHHYRTIGYEGQGQRLVLPSRLFTRARRARVRVRVNDGFNEGAATIGPLRSLGAPPQIQVLSPLVGRRGIPRGRADASFALHAIAYDDAGRKLSDRALRWRLGRSTLLRRASGSAMLPAGRVRLTVEARDRFGRRGRRTVVLNVAGAPPRFTRITGPMRLRPKVRQATLRIAAAFPSTLRIQGRRLTVGHAPVNVVVRLPKRGAQVSIPMTLTSGRNALRARVVVVRR